jgi:hypothetical protein
MNESVNVNYYKKTTNKKKTFKLCVTNKRNQNVTVYPIQRNYNPNMKEEYASFTLT